ncbi:hypothetical protein ACHWQZ_G017748 [Mnemiopsis leidyi]
MAGADGICGENYAGRMVAITILSSVCVLTVFGNTMVLLAFFRNRSLRSFGNYFLISLAISDLVMGCWTFPNTIANLVLCKSWMSELLCQMSGYIDNVILTNSLVTLAACSYDRYLVITRPLFYKRCMTGKRTLLILSATWIYSMSLSLPPFCGIGQFRLSKFSRTCALTHTEPLHNFKIYFSSYIIFTFIPPLSIMVACYYFIFQTARQVNANDPNVLKQGGAWKGIKNFKAGLMIAVIIGVYLIFVLPVMLLATLQVVFNVHEIPKDAALIVVYLVMCNSFSNPIIYGIMNKEFRKTFRNILSCRSDRSFRQMNYRRESLAYSTNSCNGTTLLRKRDLSNSNNSSLSIGSSTISSNQSVSRQNSELKRYFNGKRNNSLGGAKDNCVLPQGGTIIELSEHSTSDCNREHVNQNFRTNSDQVKNLAISEFNPFRFIWTIKSSSYECVCNRKGRKRTISF